MELSIKVKNTSVDRGAFASKTCFTCAWFKPGFSIKAVNTSSDKSPFFSIQNIKLTKSFKKGWKVALGVQNLLNFTPPAYSIMRAFDPFDKNVGVNNPNNYTFDAAYVYTSFQGITGFASLRYEFKKKWNTPKTSFW